MTMYRVQDAAPIPFLIMAISNGTAAGLPIRTPAPDFSADRLLAADHPSGIGATVIPATTKRAMDLHDLTLSTFLVDHPPGASTVLHSPAIFGLCAGVRAIERDPCFSLAYRRRHLSRGRDAGRAGFCLPHCVRKCECPRIRSGIHYPCYRFASCKLSILNRRRAEETPLSFHSRST